MAQLPSRAVVSLDTLNPSTPIPLLANHALMIRHDFLCVSSVLFMLE